MTIYLVVIAAVGLGVISLSTLVGLVSQNFLVLYGFIIVAFVRTEVKWFRWPIAIAGVASCVFFLSGFLWWMAYPAVLLAVGYLACQRRRLKSVNSRSLPKARN